MATPATPSRITCSMISASEIDVYWSSSGANTTHYYLERSPDDATWAVIATLPVTCTAYYDKGLTAGTLYYYRVRGYESSSTTYGSYSTPSASATTWTVGTVDRLLKWITTTRHGDSNLAEAVTGGVGTFAATLTANRIWTFPDAAGTVALVGGAPMAHNLFSASHGDTVAGPVARGDLAIGVAGPLWDNLPLGGAAGSFVTRDANDVLWSTLTLPNAATTGDILYASGANAIGNLADVAVGSVLISGGVGAAPAYSASPTLTGLTLSGLTASTVIYSNAGKAITSLANAAGVLTNDGAGGLSWAPGGGGAPGGNDHNVQVNNAGAFAGYDNFSWDHAANVLTITGDLHFADDGVPTDRNIGVVTQTTVDTSGNALYIYSGTGNGTGWGGYLEVTAGDAGASGGGGDAFFSAGAGSSTAGGANVYAYGGDAPGDGWGGGLNLNSGSAADNDGAGGDISVYSGGGFGAGGGGNITFVAGSGGNTGNGGFLTMMGGAAGAAAGNGGDCEIYGGNSGNGNGGNIHLLPGIGVNAAADGHVLITNVRSGFSAIFDTASVAASDKTFTFPNASGTFALQSAASGTFTTADTPAKTVTVTNGVITAIV